MPLLVLIAGSRGVRRGRSFKRPLGKAHQNGANDNHSDNSGEESGAGCHVQITQHTNSAPNPIHNRQPL